MDTETDEFTTHDNHVNANAAQGAGIQAGRTVIDLGAGALITGHVGPKAFDTLRAGGVRVYSGVAGTVQEAVHTLKLGGLEAVDKADVEGHWA